MLHDRPNHMNYWDDHDFFDRFRLTKESVQLILGQIEERIRYPTERYKEDDETAEHILNECPALAGPRQKYFGAPTTTPKDIK